MRCDTNKKI